MAEVATGKEYTITASGTITGSHVVEWRNPGVAQPFWMLNYMDFTITAFGAVIYARNRAHTSGSVRYFDLECWTGPGLGMGAGTAGSVSNSFPSSGTTTWTLPIAGNYTISVPVQEMYRIDSDGQFPSYGGTAFDDPPISGTVPVYDVMKVGGTISVTANIAGISLSTSEVITSASTVGYPIANDGTVFDWGMPGTVDIQSIWNRSGSVQLSAPFSFSDANHSSNTDSGLYMSATGNGYKTEASCSLNAPRGYNYAAVNRLPDGSAYNGTVQFLIDRSGSALAGTISSDALGTITDTNTQSKYSAGASFFSAPFAADSASFPADKNWTFGTAESVVLNEWTPFRAWVSPSWLSSMREDVRDWRVLNRAFSAWAAGTIIQSGTVTLYTSAGTAGASPFSITLPDATTDVGLKGTAWSGASLQYGRYLVVEAKITLAPDQVPTIGGTASAATLTLGSKQWTKDYQGGTLNFGSAAFTTGTVDLCCATNGTAFYATQDSRFPLVGPAPYSVADDALWGVSNAPTITLTSGDGGTVTVKSLTLQRLNHSVITSLPAFMNWVSAGDGSEYRIDYLWGRTDWRKSLEGIDCYRNGTVVTQRSISDLMDSIQTGGGSAYPRDGWSVAGTAAGSVDANRNNDAGIAAYLCGSGATYAGSAWTYWQNVSAAGSVALSAQLLADSIGEWPPNCGDVFGFYGGGTTGNIEIRGAHYFRGGVWGIVYQSGNNLAASGSVVTVTDLTENDAGGTATTDAYGGYYSGTPFVQGQHSARAQTGGQASVLTIPEHKWMRAGFRVPPGTVGGGLCYDVNGAGRHAIAYQVDGTIIAGMNTDAFGAMYGSVSTGIAGTPTCLMWEESKQSRLYMLYTAGGSVYVAYTRNEGIGWTMAGTIATSGTAARSVYARDGKKYYFWQGGGTLYTRVYDSTDTALGTAYPIVTSGVDNDSIDCQEWTANKGQWRLNVHYRSSGNLITVSTSDGVTYS